MKVKDQG